MISGAQFLQLSDALNVSHCNYGWPRPRHHVVPRLTMGRVFSVVEQTASDHATCHYCTVNWRCQGYAHCEDFHLACNMLLHYLVKVNKSKNVTGFDSIINDCWHVPENTLRTWFNIVRQTVSRLQTLTDWLTFCSFCINSWTLLHHSDFFHHDYLRTAFVLSRLHFVRCTYI